MRRRKKAVRRPEPLPPVKLERAEYDFKCPDEELLECLRYELARESDPIKEAIHDLRTEYPDGLISVASKTSLLFVLFPHWPKVPYLSIPPRQRAAAARYFRHPSDQEVEADSIVPDHLFPEQVKLLLYGFRHRMRKSDRPRVSLPGERSELVLLRIDWQLPDSQLRRFFKSYLKLYRPTVVPSHERTGKEAPNSKRGHHLQQLGMYRVLRANDWSVARAIGTGHFKQYGLSDRKVWYKARKAVESSIADFTSEFHRLIDLDFPEIPPDA